MESPDPIHCVCSLADINIMISQNILPIAPSNMHEFSGASKRGTICITQHGWVVDFHIINMIRWKCFVWVRYQLAEGNSAMPILKYLTWVMGLSGLYQWTDTILNETKDKFGQISLCQEIGERVNCEEGSPKQRLKEVSNAQTTNPKNSLHIH